MLELLVLGAFGVGKGSIFSIDRAQPVEQVTKSHTPAQSEEKLWGFSAYYLEDFEDTTADGWEFIDGNGDSVTFSVAICGSIHQPPANCGTFALNYDDDAAGGSSPPANEIAITPEIALPTDYNTLLLKYDYGFDSYNEDDTVRVYLLTIASDSTVDTILLNEVALTTTNQSGTEYIDITPHLSGAVAVKIMFQYVDAGGWNWNVAFDNVAIGAPAPTVLYSDDFEDGNADDWTLVDGNSDGVTFAVEACSQIHQPPTNCGTYALNYDDDAAGSSAPPSNEMAISPAIAIPAGLTSVMLAYDYGFDSYEVDDTARTYVLLYDSTGAVETLLVHEAVLSTTNDSGRYLTNIPTEGKDSMKIMFQYVDAGGWNWNVAFDNVTVMYVENDLGIADVILPEFDFYSFYPPTEVPTWPQTGDISVVVYNNGFAPVSGVEVSLTVNGVTNTYTIDTIGIGETDTIVFSGLTIDSVVEVMATHNFLLDEYPDNNTLELTYDYTSLYKIATDTITYADTLDPVGAIGVNGDLGPSRIAIKFDSSDLYLYNGRYIKKVFFYHCASASGCISGGQNAIAIYPDAGGYPDHNNPIFTKVIGDVGTTPTMVVVSLDSLPASDTSLLRIGSLYPFYVAREIESLSGGYPFAIDAGPCWSGRGCWIQADTLGSTWYQLTDFGIDNNWILGIVLGDELVGGNEYIVVPGDVKLLGAVKNGYVFLNAPADRDMKVSIYNTAGRLVRVLHIRKGHDRAFIGNIPAGAYFYITDDNKSGALLVR